MARDVLDAFHPAVRAWFRSAFPEPTLAQRKGWPPILAGKSTLLLAPTGSGKTLAAFLAAIDRLMFTPEPPKKARCRILYVSPLKALAVDVTPRLRRPDAIRPGARYRIRLRRALQRLSLERALSTMRVCPAPILTWSAGGFQQRLDPMCAER